MANVPQQQLLHLVFGGELDNIGNVTFKDLMHRLLDPESGTRH